MESASPYRKLRGSFDTTFSALRYRNYRLWFIGQSFSLMGTWFQNVAQSWLMYQMTHSKIALGWLAFAGTVPTLLLMLPAGVVADRVPRQRLLVVVQTVMMLQAFTLALLVALRALQPWHLIVLAVWLGIANSFDAPTRHAMVAELVEGDRHTLMNAIALNSLMFNLSRVVGPALGGVLLASLGAFWCFALNGLSFLAVIGALLAMTPMQVHPNGHGAVGEPWRRQLVEGVRYALSDVFIRRLIIMAGVSSMFGASYITLLPAYAVEALRLQVVGFGLLHTTVGLGALVGALTVAAGSRSPRRDRWLAVGALGFPAALLTLALARQAALAMVILFVVGFTFVVQFATVNTLIQSYVPDALRGRVISLYTLMFFGLTPFGALLAGAVAHFWSLTAGIALGAGAALVWNGLLLRGLRQTGLRESGGAVA
ncbi:Enterobactin exporter EntS [bacterium HR11]|nr:Enterobactin exporter EntS [bacterium HR11]